MKTFYKLLENLKHMENWTKHFDLEYLLNSFCILVLIRGGKNIVQHIILGEQSRSSALQTGLTWWLSYGLTRKRCGILSKKENTTKPWKWCLLGIVEMRWRRSETSYIYVTHIFLTKRMIFFDNMAFWKNSIRWFRCVLKMKKQLMLKHTFTITIFQPAYFTISEPRRCFFDSVSHGNVRAQSSIFHPYYASALHSDYTRGPESAESMKSRTCDILMNLPRLDNEHRKRNSVFLNKPPNLF